MLLDSNKPPESVTTSNFLHTLYVWQERVPQEDVIDILEACHYYFLPRCHFMATSDIPWRYSVRDFKNPAEPFIAVIKTVDATEPDDKFEIENPIIIIDFFDLKNNILHRIEHDTGQSLIELKAVSLHDKEINRIKRQFDKRSYLDNYNDFPIRENRFRYNIAPTD